MEKDRNSYITISLVNRQTFLYNYIVGKKTDIIMLHLLTSPYKRCKELDSRSQFETHLISSANIQLVFCRDKYQLCHYIQPSLRNFMDYRWNTTKSKYVTSGCIRKTVEKIFPWIYSCRKLILHFIAVKSFWVINIYLGCFKAPFFFIWCFYRIFWKL